MKVKDPFLYVNNVGIYLVVNKNHPKIKEFALGMVTGLVDRNRWCLKVDKRYLCPSEDPDALHILIGYGKKLNDLHVKIGQRSILIIKGKKNAQESL